MEKDVRSFKALKKTISLRNSFFAVTGMLANISVFGYIYPNINQSGASVVDIYNFSQVRMM